MNVDFLIVTKLIIILMLIGTLCGLIAKKYNLCKLLIVITLLMYIATNWNTMFKLILSLRAFL